MILFCAGTERRKATMGTAIDQIRHRRITSGVCRK